MNGCEHLSLFLFRLFVSGCMNVLDTIKSKLKQWIIEPSN